MNKEQKLQELKNLYQATRDEIVAIEKSISQDEAKELEVEWFPKFHWYVTPGDYVGQQFTIRCCNEHYLEFVELYGRNIFYPTDDISVSFFMYGEWGQLSVDESELDYVKQHIPSIDFRLIDEWIEETALSWKPLGYER